MRYLATDKNNLVTEKMEEGGGGGGGAGIVGRSIPFFRMRSAIDIAIFTTQPVVIMKLQ